MGPIGIPELVVVLLVGLVWAVPIAAGIWALITLYRIRVSQEDVRRRLVAIERIIQSGRT